MNQGVLKRASTLCHPGVKICPVCVKLASTYRQKRSMNLRNDRLEGNPATQTPTDLLREALELSKAKAIAQFNHLPVFSCSLRSRWIQLSGTRTVVSNCVLHQVKSRIQQYVHYSVKSRV
ncbi:MAG: hypothetical protein HC771_01550 [Synechococcales cyanobacterium CRU_2_2]|nr:hypothetical protein [Synechococcales cyanobacterium CRU_2_2]